MSSIQVDNLPDDLYMKLKFSAALNHTSVDREIVACLEKALMPEKKLSKTGDEKAIKLLDHMGFSYRADELKKYLEQCV